jgi:hypothetical protein
MITTRLQHDHNIITTWSQHNYNLVTTSSRQFVHKTNKPLLLRDVEPPLLFVLLFFPLEFFFALDFDPLRDLVVFERDDDSLLEDDDENLCADGRGRGDRE